MKEINYVALVERACTHEGLPSEVCKSIVSDFRAMLKVARGEPETPLPSIAFPFPVPTDGEG